MSDASVRRDTVRVVHIPAPDVADVLLGTDGGGRKLDRGLADALGSSVPLEVVSAEAGGWSRTLSSAGDGPLGQQSRGVVVTSVSAEVADPSPDPHAALTKLAGAVRERGGRLVALNASSITPRDGGDPLDLRIRRLNLLLVEISHESGLSVLDADRVVTEAAAPEKVRGPFDYAPEVCAALRSAFIAILGDLGLATHPVLELRLPFVRQATDLHVERWLKREGDAVAPDEPVCEIRMGHARRLTRPTSAIVLGSLDGRTPLLQRLVSRERVRSRSRSAVLSVVARDEGILRRIVRGSGDLVRSGEALALLTRDARAPLDPDSGANVFRAVMRTDDPVIEAML